MEKTRELTTLQIVLGIISSIGFTLVSLYLVIIGLNHVYLKSNEIIGILEVGLGVYILSSIWGASRIPLITEVSTFLHWLKSLVYCKVME